MKSIKNIIVSVVTFAAGFIFSSCDIDLLPLDKIVYENFWTNRDDVESVVAATYASAMSSDYVSRLIVWGETRSDNVQIGNTPSDDLRYLMKGSLKTTNVFCDWSAMYKVINYCNVVLYEAPSVFEKDPNYTESDLRINIAECKFLRAFSYLTLIKTFKDVPFTFDASIDDTQNFRLPQTKFEAILDTLIADIEGCKNYAPNRYSDQARNTGRVTRVAMYSLLAEMYLWRASDYNLSKEQQNEYYRKCIENCDWVLNYKIKQYEDNDVEGLDLRSVMDRRVYSGYGYALLAEEITAGSNRNGPMATNSIFGKGGAFETIFELTYNYPGSIQSNAAVRSLYGESASVQSVIASDKVLESKPDNTASYSSGRLFSVPSDYRSIASFYFNESSGGYNIYKFTVENNQAGDVQGDYGRVGNAFTASTRTQNISSRASTPPNWIFYRLSEIMLFRAEAEIELAFNMDAAESEPEEEVPAEGKARKVAVSGSALATAEELKTDAFNLISAVYLRSNPMVDNQPKFAPTQPATYAEYHTLLMDERRREFLFEGKRYFDLVRSARRIGNTTEFRQILNSKYAGNSAVAVKMSQMDFMYMPVAKSEMKVNPSLVQNSCYLDEEENVKN